MLKVGVTGGIGAGKSVVCRVFETLGIPVFNADLAARHLLENDAATVAAVKRLLGDEVYIDGVPDRAAIATRVFGRPELLQQLNTIIHPATIAYGEAWMEAQTTPYVIKEAAIFFESGSHKHMDVMIGVFAPLETRITRAMTRPGMTREKILERVAGQMNEEEKMKLCDHVVQNDGVEALIPQIVSIHKQLMARVK